MVAGFVLRGLPLLVWINTWPCVRDECIRIIIYGSRIRTTFNYARTIINTGFVHFNDPVNNPSGNVADLIEFDADTVTNFTAGSTIQQRNRAFLENLAASGNPASAQNIMLVDSAAEIAATNLSAVGESWVAFANDTGSILYSQNGNFANNAEEIGQINGSDPAFFFSEKNVVVV